MLNPYQCELTGYREDGGIYHQTCMHLLDVDLWEQIVVEFEEQGPSHWQDSVSERFAEARGGSLLIRYSIDEEESARLESEVDYFLELWSFGDYPEALQDYLDEYFHDGLDTGDLPANPDQWGALISDWLWDNSEEAGLGFVYCDHCSERVQ